MKFTFTLTLIIFCSITCLAQKPDEKAIIAARQKILKKQILVDDLDDQAKNVPFAAVRVFVRTRLAEWLWKNGTDETGRAEPLAVKAVEELYEKPDEMPDSRFLKTSLFSLFIVNDRETVNKLRAKYDISDTEDLYNSASFTNIKGNDKIIAEKVRKSLTDTRELAVIQGYLMLLQGQKSSQFVPLLSEIINIQESGRNNFSTQSLLWIADDFKDATVPNDLKIRFYKIVLNRAKNALQTTDGGEIHFADLALFKVLPDIAANAPEMTAEASVIKAALSVKTTQGEREYQESEQRIAESANRLDGLIAEADRIDNKSMKYSFLSEASRLAEREEKFQLAVDLIEKTIEDQSKENNLPIEAQMSAHDQRLGLIAGSALRKNDFDSAEYATKKIINDLKKADALSQIAYYFLGKKDVAAASNPYDEALKLLSKAENDQSKIVALLRLISAAAAIDQSRLSEVISITAKAINNLPTLNPEDKPGTANFKNYVSTVLQTDFILYVTIGGLTRNSKNQAMSFADQINRKEIRIIADLALAIDPFAPRKKAATQ